MNEVGVSLIVLGILLFMYALAHILEWRSRKRDKELNSAEGYYEYLSSKNQDNEDIQFDNPPINDGALAEGMQKDIERLEDDNNQLIRELKETTDELRQKEVDYDKLRRLTNLEREERALFVTKKILAEILIIADNIDRAIDSFSAELVGTEEIQKGLVMIQKQLLTFFSSYDVTPISSEGEKFDPKIHEAVAVLSTRDLPDGMVAEEIQKGYLMGGKLLRAAKVRVTQALPLSSTTSDDDDSQAIERRVIQSFTKPCPNCTGQSIVRVWSTGDIDYVCPDCHVTGAIPIGEK